MTDESPILAAERAEQDARPEVRSALAVAAESGYHADDESPYDWTGLAEKWRLMNDRPEPADPWDHMQITCDRCDETREPHCTHGHQLCSECFWTCQQCVLEHEDAAALVEARREEYWS